MAAARTQAVTLTASPPSGDEWISTAEAAELCRVSENTMKAWARDGLVLCQDDSDGAILVHRPTLEQWLRRAASDPLGA